MPHACRPRRSTRTPILPGEREYDRGEKREFARDFRLWLAGCALVVLIVALAFAIYAVLLIRSGWHG